MFDLTVASAGVSEKLLKTLSIPYKTLIIHPSSHAGYYPDALAMSVKIVFSPENGRLLGAQIVGFDGVDKRIDLFATVIKNNGTVYDLQDIEHAYAPPYASAKDITNITGFAAENILKGRTKVVQWYDIKNTTKESHCLIDVRTTDEFALGTIEGAKNIPLDEIRSRINEIPKDKEILLFCGVGLRGYVASRILLQLGCANVFNLSGRYKTWEHATQKQSNEDIFKNDFIGKDDMIYQSEPRENSAKSEQVVASKIEVNACGLQCPGPIMQLKKEMEKASVGTLIEITATDQGFKKDSESWCRVTGNKLLSIKNEKGKITALIEKSAKNEKNQLVERADGKTLVIFSDDLDKALAGFVIANGAASMGKKVTMFFTFWGLNVIKKVEKPALKKDFMSKMFGMMMASSSLNLKLSKMNMFGLGTIMMRKRMADKKVDSLESLIAAALKSGIELVACQMSMDVMGVQKEELMEGVTIGGVASYLENAEAANVNLFI